MTETPTSLVTGGAGFIGSHVATDLLRQGHRVVVLDDLSGGFKENVPDAASLVVGSVADPEVVAAVFDDFDVDYVFHLAAYAAEGLSHFIRRFNYTNNVLGSINLINAAVNSQRVRCFVFTSSIAVYGSNQLPMREDMVPAPEDPYGIAKYAVEQDLAASHEMFGLPYIVFRPHNVYGERQNIGDRYRNVIGIFMNQIMRDEPLTVFGDGTQSRAFTHVDDVAIPIARSIQVPAAYQRTFNIGGDHAYTINELIDQVAEVMSATPKVDHLPPRNEVLHAYSDHSLAADTFGELCTGIDLPTGLRRMADWVRQRGPQAPTIFRNVEIAREMPPSWRQYVES